MTTLQKARIRRQSVGFYRNHRDIIEFIEVITIFFLILLNLSLVQAVAYTNNDTVIKEPVKTITVTPTATITPTPTKEIIKMDDPISVITSVWGNSAEIGIAIAKCESSLNPQAINTHNSDGIFDYGLFQLHGQNVLNAIQNAQIAYQMFLRRGTNPWNSSAHCWNK